MIKLLDHTCKLLLATGAVSNLLSVDVRAENPFITSIYTADPSAHVWADGRLYLYPSRDIDPPRGCDLMDHYHVFSTDDMVTWRDEGEILNASEVSWGRKEGGFMWAPDCAFRNGTYYYYFPHPSETRWNNSWKIGVATSTSPVKDFKVGNYIQGLPANAMIDPAVFVDTDNTPYLYFGGGGHCMGGKLKDNMIEMESPAQDMVGLKDFHEASWVFKRNDTYYLTYADNHPRHNCMRYATSTNALGPWTYKGVYLDVTDCDTTHGSVVQYKGQWYQFYHNCSISGRGNLRSVCVDKLEFEANGDIKMVVQTKTGPPSVGPAPMANPAATKYEAKSVAVGNGATIADDAAASGGKAVQNLQMANAYLEFDAINGGSSGGRDTIAIHYASKDKGKLRLTVNGADYSFINTPPTGGWDSYSGTTSITVPLQPGTTNTVRLSGGSGGANVDYITVVPLSNEMK